jgi:hypothetical protein
MKSTVPKISKKDHARFDFLFLEELFNEKIDLTSFELKTIEEPSSSEFYTVILRRELHFEEDVLNIRREIAVYEWESQDYLEYLAEDFARSVVGMLQPNKALSAKKLHKYYEKMMDAEFNA